MKVKVAQSCLTLWTPWTIQAMEFSGPEYCLSLLQGIFPTQGSNPGLPHCKQILYKLSHQGSPRILEWVAYPFSSGTSQPRNRTRVSCIAGRFFTTWAIRETQDKVSQLCPTLPPHGHPPGSSVHGILWTIILEWVAIPFSGGLISKMKQNQSDGVDQ